MKRDNGQLTPELLREQAREILSRSDDAGDRLPDRIDNILEELRLRQIELELQREELRAARRELVDLRHELDDIHNYAPVNFLSVDAEGRVISAGTNAAALLGTTCDQLCGTLFTERVDSENRDHMQVCLAEALSTETERDCQLLLMKDGDGNVPVNAVFTPQADGTGQPEQIRVSLLRSYEDREGYEELRTQQRQYSTLSREGKIGVWEFSLSDGRLILDDTIKTLLGYEDAEFDEIGENWIDLYHPDDHPGIFEAIEEGRAGRLSYYEARLRLFHKDGTLRSFQVQGSVGVVGEGPPEKVYGTWQDITELREIEKALERTRFSMDNVQEGQLWIRPDGTFADCNNAVCRALGYSREEILSMAVCDIDPGMAADFSSVHFAEMREIGSATRETTHRTKGGEEIPLEICSTYLEHDGEEYICALARDITERKRIREHLSASEEKYRSLVEHAQDGIVIVSKGLLTFVNPALAKLLGYTVDEMLGKEFEQFIPPAYIDEIARNYRARMSGEDVPPAYESVLVRKDGSPVEIEYNVSVITYDGGPADLTFIRDITERRRAEDQRRLLSSIVQQTSEGIAVLNEEAVLQFVNKAFADLHGYDPEEMVGQPVAMCHGPEQTASVENVRRAVLDKGYFSGELEHFRRDGSSFPTMMHITKFQEDSARPTGVLAMMRDISDRREAATHLRLQRDLAFSLGSVCDLQLALNLVLESLIDLDGIDCGAVYQVDGDRGVIELAAHCRLWESFLKTAASFDAKDSVQAGLLASGLPVYGHHADLLPGLEDSEEYRALKGLAVIPIHFNSEPVAVLALSSRAYEEIPTGSRHTLETVAAQIGAAIGRVRAESALRESEQRYDELFTSIQEGVAVLGPDYKVTFCNPAMARILEEDTVEAVIGGEGSEYVSRGEREEIEARKSQVESGEMLQHEQQIVTAKGNRKHLYVLATPRRENNGEFKGAILSAMDITETKRLRDLSERARRLETAGQVAGQVAHDFNNLLGPLLAYPDLIRDEIDDDHGANKYLRDIEDAANQMAEINQQLLTLGRRGHYSQEPLNLNTQIQEVLGVVGLMPESVTVDVQLDEGLMNVKGGASQLSRVFSNLIVNAVDAMAGAGKLTIRSQNFYVDTQRQSYERVPRGEFVKITIADTGSGMAEDVAAKIFDPFFTTKTSDSRRGSGLGLSVVHAVVQDHGGHIDVSSVPGRGTSFYLYFPITRKEIEVRIAPELIGGEERILIVDDDSLQRDVSATLLTKLGYRVRTASSGEEAFKLLEREAFDLLVLDMVMPPGMDGVDTFERVREISSEQKAVIVSGFAESDRVQRAQRLGAGEFVKKPLSLEAIARAVRQELDRPVE
ncbi:MAG: PAS domain S-box protein [bacterium]|nr:PAS domain S-box protein [bacterium]